MNIRLINESTRPFGFGTLKLAESRGPLSGLKIDYEGLTHLLRERPEDADRIADYAIAYGPIKDHEDMLPLLAWLDEGINPNLGSGWL